jgi:anti-sigma B factor antagonist
MQTKVRDTDSTRIVDVEGDVDMTTSMTLLEQLKAAAEQAPGSVFAVNLSGVPYMDSSGIASLLETMKHARKRKLEYVLIGLSDNLRNVFSLSRLDQVFRIVDSEEELNGRD